MEKLNSKTQAMFAGMANGPAPPKEVLGDPTKPQTPEENVYWKEQNEFIMLLCDGFAEPGTKETCMENTELFSYSSEDGTYTIESRFFRAEGENPPLLIHFHGGGMTTSERDQSYELRTCAIYRSLGCSVLTPEFRNARDHAFPAGIDDCVTTLQWAHKNKEKLGFGDIVVTTGCSGGGNLCLAIFIRALQKGLPARELIDGIFSDAPFIRPSYVGNEVMEAIFAPLSPTSALEALCRNYTQTLEDSKDPAAWPLLVSDEILQQFPPTSLRGAEFDTLKVDAKELYDRLADLGVEGCSYGERKNAIHCQHFMPSLIGQVDSFVGIAEIAQFAKTLSFMKKSKFVKHCE